MMRQRFDTVDLTILVVGAFLAGFLWGYIIWGAL
jgi:hypothetical protein